MELFLPPKNAKKPSRYEKGHTTWNKGRKGFTTQDKHLQQIQLDNLAEGRKLNWEKRDRTKVYNQKPVVAYDLDGKFVGVYRSSRFAAMELGLREELIRRACRNQGRHGSYQFRFPVIIEFNGRKLVKKENIAPYKKKCRWDYDRKENV